MPLGENGLVGHVLEAVSEEVSDPGHHFSRHLELNKCSQDLLVWQLIERLGKIDRKNMHCSRRLVKMVQDVVVNEGYSARSSSVGKREIGKLCVVDFRKVKNHPPLDYKPFKSLRRQTMKQFFSKV